MTTLADGYLKQDYKYLSATYYDRDRDGNHYHTEQDEVMEVLAEEEAKNQLFSFFDYIDAFVRVSNVRSKLF